MKVRISLLLMFLVSMVSCIPQKKFVYLQDGSSASAGTYPPFTLKISPRDILSIQVFTINAEAFPGIASTVDKQVVDNRSAYEKGFIVDEDGFLQLPLIGKIKLAGLSISDARDSISSRFSQYMDDPVVLVKKLSFKITVLGEVNKPGLFYIPNEKISFLEALGMAGDLTFFGNRKEIKVVRQTGDGYREIMVDLTTRQPLNSEIAFLYPDDVVYVPPIKRRGVTTTSPAVAIVTSIVATLTLIVSVILRETN